MRALSWAVGGSAGGQLGPARLQRRGATSRAVLGLGEEAREVPSGGGAVQPSCDRPLQSACPSPQPPPQRSLICTHRVKGGVLTTLTPGPAAGTTAAAGATQLRACESPADGSLAT